MAMAMAFTFTFTLHNTKDAVAFYLKDRYRFIAEIYRCYDNQAIFKSMSLTAKTNAILVLLLGMEKGVLYKLHDRIDLPEMLKACKVLDSARYLRQLTRKLSKLHNPRRIRRQQLLIDKQMQLVAEFNYSPFKASLTGCRNTTVKHWTRRIPPDVLQTRAFMFGVSNWKELADLVHLSRKDFKVNWFLDYCFGKPAPNNSLVQILNTIDTDNFGYYYTKYKLPYVCLRVASEQFLLRSEDKLLIVQQEQLDTILWYWNELNSPDTELVFALRLHTATSNQIKTLTYGKLLDAVLKTSDNSVLKSVLIGIAEQRLQVYKGQSNLSLNTHPVAILCDASSSMQVAIRTSSIFASLLSVLTEAKMLVFRARNNTINCPPKTVSQAISMATTIRAYGTTSPASSLYYLYINDIPAHTVVVVTDEEENIGYDDNGVSSKNNFAGLWKKYLNEVCPEARLVFISFTDSNRDGDMIKSLRNVMGDSYCRELITVHKVNRSNPDLNRLDYILASMSCGTDDQDPGSGLRSRTMVIST